MLRAGDAIGLIALATLCVGVVMVNSASLAVGAGDSVTLSSILLSRPTLYAVLAVAAMLAAATPQAHRLVRAGVAPGRARARSLAILTALLMLVCLLPYAPVIGREVNGAYRWVSLPIPGLSGFGFQPSELAKWAMPLVVAWYAVSRGEELKRFLPGLLPGLVATGAVAAAIALEDLGTGMLVAAAACVVLVAGGARIWQFAVMAPMGVAAVGLAILAEPYRMRRLTAFVNPYADPESSGYHMIQSMVAVANGQGFGRGLGFGLQKFGYLPEDRTDFLFAIICEELGIAGAALVLALYIGLLWTGWSVVRREMNLGIRLFALGVLATVGLQALINLFAVTGLGPTKGIALPLISAGGTGWILTCAALGLLIGMDRAHAREEFEGVSDPVDEGAVAPVAPRSETGAMQERDAPPLGVTA